MNVPLRSSSARRASGRAASRGPAPFRAALVAFAVALVVAPVAHADEALGRQLTRRAQQALREGDSELALDLMERARIEWPGSPVVAHTLADARFQQGDYAGALVEYDKGSGGDLAYRAYFNQGVTLDTLAERDLEAKGVPIDPAALPPDAPPGPLIEAINEGLERLETARSRFLESLAERADAAARESVAAINRRMDDLRQMKEELEQRQQEEQENEDDQQDQDQEQQDQPQDQEQQQDPQDEGEQDDRQDQQQQQGDQGQQDQDEQEQDEQQGEDDQQPEDEQQGQPPQGQPGEERELTPQEMQKLLDQLEDLEEKARAMQRIRRAQQHQAVEKDW